MCIIILLFLVCEFTNDLIATKSEERLCCK